MIQRPKRRETITWRADGSQEHFDHDTGEIWVTKPGNTSLMAKGEAMFVLALAKPMTAEDIRASGRSIH